MQHVEIEETIGFKELCELWSGLDKTELVRLLIEHQVDCYSDASGKLRKLSKVQPSHFETLKFDRSDIELVGFLSQAEAKARKGQKVTVEEARKAIPSRTPSVADWEKSVATVVKLIGHFSQPGNVWPRQVDFKSVCVGLLGAWNQGEDAGKFYLHDKAERMLWKHRKEVMDAVKATVTATKEEAKSKRRKR
jgi:hypothetical protein